jgi:iron complex outermembrane recepter protein
MSVTPRLLLCSVSATAMAFGAPAFAQTAQAPLTPGEIQQCQILPDPQQRALCLQGQRAPDGTAAEAGDIATQPPEVAAAQRAESGTIIVTGSRIRTNPVTSPDPITVISPDLELRGGAMNTAEILQQSPVAAGALQITDLLSAGSFVTGGGPGAETLSLRGLGVARTLVLINSRRAGAAGTQGQISGFDLNVLPSSLLSSVDILKTGASSIYGSDAIAGVVNLQTKRATDGLDLRAFGSLPTRSGGGQDYNLSAAYGREFARGHFLVAADYTNFTRLKRGDRDFTTCPTELLFDPSGTQRLDIVDPRTGEPRCLGSIHNMLLLTNVGFGTPTLNGVPFTVVQFNNPGDRFNEFLSQPTPSALLTMPTGWFGFPTACTGASTAAQLEICRRAQGLQNEYNPLIAESDILPQRERMTFWADGSYKITDTIELVGEMLFNRRKTEFQSFRQLFFFQFLGDSPALTAFYCDPVRRPPNTNCDPTSPGDPMNTGFSGNVLFRPVVLVPTGNSTKVDYYRTVAGLRGEMPANFLAGNWRWDSYLQFSRSDGDYTNPRIFEDAVNTQEYRTRLCAGTVTRIRGVPCRDINWTDPRVLAGNFTQEERDFLFGEETGNTKFDTWTAEASVSGSVIRLPAGNVGLALGAQWRRDSIDDQPGPIAQANNVWGQSTAGRTAGHSVTQEAFGEIDLPLIHNTPFIQYLGLSGAARITNVYAERLEDGVSSRSNNNWTYKLGFNWQTNDWLRFRGSYGTSYRSPALFEQFLANQTGFLGQLAIDPCVNWGQKIAAGTIPQLVADRCAALGIDPAYGGAGSSATIITGGGIGVLEPETSKAKVVSAIVSPRVGLWQGMRFNVVVDYFDIEVSNQIGQLGAGNIIFRCLNSDNYPNDPVCSLFTRAPQGSAAFPNILTVNNSYFNINRQKNRGVDLTSQVNQDLGRFGSFNAVAQMTWQIERFTELFTGVQENFVGTVGEPTWTGNFRFTWNNRPWSLFYGLNVIGAASNEQARRNAAGGNVCSNNVLRGGLICPIFRVSPQFYHSASVTRSLMDDRFSLTLGVRNIFDTQPPLVSGAFSPISGIGNAPVFGSQYDFIGRRVFASFRVRM